MISTLVFFVYSYSQGISLTEIAALLAPAFMAYRPIKDLSKVVTSIQRSMAAAAPLFRADRYRHVAAGRSPTPSGLMSSRIKSELVDTEFSYDERKIIERREFRDSEGRNGRRGR